MSVKSRRLNKFSFHQLLQCQLCYFPKSILTLCICPHQMATSILFKCSLIHYLEWTQLKREFAKAIELWILHDIKYRWGCLLWIVMDNSPIFLAALWWLEKHYGIKHIRISRYNSHANRIVEHAYYNVWEAVFKACNRDESRWSTHTCSVFWAERVTIWKHMGCSPYFGAHGTHPLLPLDIVESNYFLPLPASSLMSMELIAH